MPAISSDTTNADQIALNGAIAAAAKEGWTVSTVNGSSAVLQRRKKIGFWGNAIASLLTGGLWLLVVLMRLINRKTETLVLSVGVDGKVHRG